MKGPAHPREPRIEPVFGAPPSRSGDGRKPRPPLRPPAWRDRRHWRWVVALVVVAALAIVMLRRPIADRLWPDTRVQALLEQGNAALAQGRLSATDGSGARQRFEAALALDSDRGEARGGLARVGEAALQHARVALEAGRLEEAGSSLELARELQVPRAQSDLVAEALRSRTSTTAGVEAMLQQALQAQRSAHLDGDEHAALPLFQRVLALQPNLTEALEGREDALAELLQQARACLAAEELAEAGALIARARSFDGGHVDLPDVQALLARAVELRLRRAERHLREGRLPAALEDYRQVLDAAPEYVAASQGVDAVASAYAVQAVRLAEDYDFARAQALLQSAREASPELPSLGRAAEAIERAQQSRSRLAQTVPRAERARRVAALLAEGARAEARGDWITPPGESAFDKLRAAQALAPEADEVRRAAARLLPATRGCFEDELRNNRIGRARACYDAWQALEPGDRALAVARTRLAQKWVAVGQEQLGAGDIAFATRALEQARALDPSAPGVDDFHGRVRSAGASGP